jgi:hypothetical protein
MSRDDGFAVADVATDLLDDPKVKALWRALGDQGRMGHALTLYTATVLASWRAGCRVPVDDAAPVWLVVDRDLLAALVDAKLLDRTGRIPPRSWKGWYGPAWDRREQRRIAGRLGGRPPKPEPNRPLTSRLSTDNPVRPSVRPSGPSVARARNAPSNGAKGGPVRLADLVTPEALAAVGKRP